jgi:tripartite-type tricarboxylate transporter receptor subunit TctC
MRHQLLAAGILAVACLERPAHAQTTNAIASPQPTPAEYSGDGGHEERRALKFLEGVPEETRQRFLAAREKALEDPKLQRLRKNAELANKEFYKAMRTKMLEIDSGLAELVR